MINVHPLQINVMVHLHHPIEVMSLTFKINLAAETQSKQAVKRYDLVIFIPY